MSGFCKAYTCKGTECLNYAFAEYCVLHQNSMKENGPMRFRHNQERYYASGQIKGLMKKYHDDQSPETWTEYLVAKAKLEGLVNEHAKERRTGPHTEADQDACDRLSRKLRRRKELKEGVRENERYLHMLQGDARINEADEIVGQRRHYLRQVDLREMTAKDAWQAFRRIARLIEENDDDRHDREAWEDEQRERDYERFGEPIHEAADNDNWLYEEPRVRTLADIANDNQSIHTSEVLNKFKEMVVLIRKIEVPEDYRWNMSKVSKTMVEITAECELTPQAAWQFSSKYYSAETIYEMEEGIFGKLMDSVWQHVKTSPDSSDLKKIVKEELEMNIGMCAQGNITRVANILVGILDGLAPDQSSRLDKIAKAIADLQPMLEGKTQVEIRLAAIKTLVPFRMSAEEMKPWVDAVVEAA